MKDILLNGIKKENPIFILFLGLYPALAITTTLEKGIVMGLCTAIVLLFSNLLISLLGNSIKSKVRMPLYLLIISILVTIIDILLKEYIPDMSQSLGIHLPLMIVDGLILGRALDFAANNKVSKSILDALGMGIGYCLALSIISLTREVLGSGTITLVDKLANIFGEKMMINLPVTALLPNKLFLSSAGAFLVVGILMAILKGGKKNEAN